MSTTADLRQHLRWLLLEGDAHICFERAIENIPPNLRSVRPDGFPYSLWMQLEHLRICQRDILEFCRNPDHESPEFPDGYWPPADAQPTQGQWDASIASFEQDQQDMVTLVEDPAVDLTAPLPHGQGQTVLREALLVADHNAYHIGQIMCLRRALGCWD